MKHLSEKIKKHENTRAHMDNSVKLAILGRQNIAMQLDDCHRLSVRKHNEEVDKNRHVLSKIIDCVKFCGAFELALRGHDETDSSENPSIFRGLVDFVASLDNVLEEHLKTATVFKGTSKKVQNELLDCMSSVVRSYIQEEVKNAVVDGQDATLYLMDNIMACGWRAVDTFYVKLFEAALTS